MMFEGDQYPYSAAAAAAAVITSESLTSLNSLSKKKRKCKNKRRFSDEQIRSLEVMFESETKLEPRKKLQLARELGLQPRQVAIWFQNRRARWKSKQLEREYGVLLANYNALASKFEASKKEKQALVLQLQKLNDLMQKSRENKPDCGQAIAEDSNGDDQPDRGDDIKIEFEATPSLKLERPELGVLSDDDSCIKAEEYFGLDEEPGQLLTMVEPADSSLTSPENWGSLDSESGLLDESGCSNQWWDFWS